VRRARAAPTGRSAAARGERARVPRSERLLAPGERVHLATREHGVVLLRPFAHASAVLAVCAAAGYGAAATPELGALRVAIVLVLAALALRSWVGLVAALARWQRRRLVITDRKAMLEEGVLVRRTTAVRLSQLDDVEIVRGGAGRLLDYGGVRVTASGRRGLLFGLGRLPEPDLVFGLLLGLEERSLLAAAPPSPRVGGPRADLQ
jgi:membrane protein YdbS with pleckstrin-like domain